MLPRLLCGIILTTVACAGDGKPGSESGASGGSGGLLSSGGATGQSGGASSAGGSANADAGAGMLQSGGSSGSPSSAGGSARGGNAAAGAGPANGGRLGASGGRGAGTGSGGASSPGGIGAGGADEPGAGRTASPGAGTTSAGAGAGAAAGASTCGACATYASAVKSGSVEPSALSALSGLAVSRSQPDIVFAHNDHSGVLVFALDMQGREHARLVDEGTTATDIEDMAVGPCGAQTCVYLADIGDNNAKRTEYAVLRFVAPTVPTTPGTNMMTVSIERFPFTYEDGSHNAEALMVAPDGTVYIVTKLAPGSGGNVRATGPSTIYRLPATLSSTGVARATKVATLTVPRTGEGAASAAAAHPCGTAFLLRTYDRVFEFTAPAGAGFEAAFTVTPRELTLDAEPQSEGIDYLALGKGFVTSGEGSGAPIYRTTCAP